MNGHVCGCTSTICNCCGSEADPTPSEIVNRPGLPALHYRVGVHGAFLETMKRRLSTMSVDAPGADGQTIETFRPLEGLTTRESRDPAIALLDSWASACDVLTFYQERIANEGYLRTATERRSVLELTRLTGYALRPGVAASVYLAYTLDDKQADPVEIPQGAKSQSIPGPDELPQFFETSEKIEARREWNNLAIRRTRPQDVNLATALSVDVLYADGSNLNLKAGDQLLLMFDDTGKDAVVRKVASTEGQFTDARTKILLQPAPPNIAAAMGPLRTFVSSAKALINDSSSGATGRAVNRAETFLKESYLGLASDPGMWVGRIINAADGTIDANIMAMLAVLFGAIQQILGSPSNGGGKVTTSPDQFIGPLLKPKRIQPRDSFSLSRNLQMAFQPGSEVLPQVLLSFVPQIREAYYKAWSSANVDTTSPALKALYVFRLSTPLFGASAPRIPVDDQGNLLPPSQWREHNLSNETTTTAFLDQAHENVLPGTFALIQRRASSGPERVLRRILTSKVTNRSAYSLNGSTTEIEVNEEWWDALPNVDMFTLRSAVVYAQSEPLELAEEPITSDISGTEIELAGLHNDLKSGRWIILSGERADIPGTQGVKESELHMISGVAHGYDASLPGDVTHTTLTLAKSTAFTYRRSNLTIYANVVKATHGETKRETLGNGDAATPFLTFRLKQPPITYTAAPTPSGAASTLHVYANQVEWTERDTLVGAAPTDHVFITKTDDDSSTSVIFGNGREGSRVPTGLENIQSVYRSGIGPAGNVRSGQISLLQTKPLGVNEVVNPLRASGGAGPETMDTARENAPYHVTSMGRIVSIEDYADFARTFAGIAKAEARPLSDGKRQLIHLTIAGIDDAPIDPTSDLYQFLLDALEKYGDADRIVQLAARELIVLVTSAKVRLQPGYQWEPVSLKMRQAILKAFAFNNRALGQPALLCELIAALHSVKGVSWADVDRFAGVPEKTLDLETGELRLPFLDEISEAVNGQFSTVKGGVLSPAQRVLAAHARIESKVIRPAQIAIFVPTLQDAIILNQVV